MQATGDAFGAGAAEATYRGQMQLVGNSADAARAQSHMWNTAIRGVTNLVGQQVQNDWKLEAEANLQALSLNQERRQEGLAATGDGASVRKRLEGFDEDAQKLLDSAASPFQANIYREGLQRMRFQVERNAVSREVAAVKQQRIDRLNAIAEGALIEVLRDPSKLNEVGLADSALQPGSIGSTVQGYDADTLKADTSDQLTAGFTASVCSAGTKSSGTFTPSASDGNFQSATNGGAHTLAPPADSCTMIIQYTNNGSAGAVTTSGFTDVDGDTITTVNGDDFLFYITKSGSFSHLYVKALQ